SEARYRDIRPSASGRPPASLRRSIAQTGELRHTAAAPARDIRESVERCPDTLQPASDAVPAAAGGRISPDRSPPAIRSAPPHGTARPSPAGNAIRIPAPSSSPALPALERTASPYRRRRPDLPSAPL